LFCLPWRIENDGRVVCLGQVIAEILPVSSDRPNSRDIVDQLERRAQMHAVSASACSCCGGAPANGAKTSALRTVLQFSRGPPQLVLFVHFGVVSLQSCITSLRAIALVASAKTS